MKYISRCLGLWCLSLMLLTSCYKEQHWGFPGPYEEDIVTPDTLPFPFDEDKESGVWLMKEGIPFHDRILFKGFTDYYVGGDTISWIEEPDGMRLIQHRNPYPVTNADHVGGRENSYRNNWVVSKYFVPVGKGKSFYMYFKATVGTFNGTAAGIVLGSSWENGREFIFGFDGFSAVAPQFFLDLYERTFSVNPSAGWPTVNEVIIPGMPAEFEVVIVDNLFYVKVNGVLCFKMQLPEQELFYYTPAVRPWRNFITMYDMYIEAPEAYTVDYAFYHKEFGYNFIQRPALTTTDNGDVLLFAEGRGEYMDGYQRVEQNIKAIGNTDIILRRSTDGGDTWEDNITVIAGENSSDTYANPQVVKANNGDLILQYSKVFYNRTGNTYVIDPSRQLIYQRISTDGGRTWSAETDISSQLNPTSVDVQHSAGHGIALRQATYQDRLVMPLNVGTNQVRVVYSDNGGQTWATAGTITGSNLRNPSIVELNDGRLMMLLSHNNVTPRNKLVSYSNDGGATWSAAASYGNGLVTGDFGHMYPSVLAGNADTGELFYVSGLNRGTDARSYNMSPVYANSPTLFSSDNQGQTFSRRGALFDKLTYNTYVVPVGNMDAVVLNTGQVLIVTEGGINTPYEGIVVYKK